MSIKIEFVELKQMQLSLICPVCQDDTYAYYRIGHTIICRKCANTFHQFMETTYFPPSPTPNHATGECSCPDPRVNFDSGIEWGVPQEDSL